MTSSSTHTIRTKLVIDFDEGTSEDLETLLKMEASTRQHVTKVRVESSWDEMMEDSIDNKVMANLFSRLGLLHNLQQFHLIGCGMHLSASPLAQLIKESPRLQMLCLDSVVLNPSRDDMKALYQAVKGHETLSCVCLSDIEFKANSTENVGEQVTNHSLEEEEQVSIQEQTLLMEPFLVSLAQDCPSMRVLELEEVPTSPGAMQAIATSTQLVDVELWNIATVGQHMESFANALQINNTLQKLELCHCSIANAGQHLTNMLMHNTTLTEVLVDVDWGVHTMFGRPIASILESNQTLTRLHLICRQQHTGTGFQSTRQHSAEDYAQVICSSLQHNQTLQRLTLEFRQSRNSRNDNSRLAAAFAQPLQRVLQHPNCTLRSFSLMGGHSILPIEWNRAITFYLGLNKAGRKDWTLDANSKFVQALIRHQDDVSTTFYMLCLHPHWIAC